MNRVILIGNLVNDPESTVLQSGIKKCSFRVATNRQYKSKETGQREADYHNVVAFGNVAKVCDKYLSKGRKCAIEGAIQYRAYESKDGAKRYFTEIIAHSVEFLSTKQPENQSQSANEFAPIDDADLPF